MMIPPRTSGEEGSIAETDFSPERLPGRSCVMELASSSSKTSNGLAPTVFPTILLHEALERLGLMVPCKRDARGGPRNRGQTLIDQREIEVTSQPKTWRELSLHMRTARLKLTGQGQRRGRTKAKEYEWKKVDHTPLIATLQGRLGASACRPANLKQTGNQLLVMQDDAV